MDQDSGRPSLTLETGDARLVIRSCGACRSIRIHAEAIGDPLSRYRLEESQSGDRVTFLFKEKPHIGILFLGNWRNHRATVSVEAPAEVTLDAKSEDGNVEVSELRGELHVRAGDGQLELRDLAGSLLLKSSDGKVRVANFSGKLDATVSDGDLTVDGVFAGLSVRSSDGKVDLTAHTESHVEQPWNIRTDDGGVVLRLPGNLAADFDVHTSDGAVHSSLPLTLDTYNSGKNDLRGRMNGGGGTITIHTGDGSLRLETD